MSTDNTPNVSGPSAPNLSAPLRGSEMGRRKSSMMPGLLGLLLGGAGGYYVAGMVFGMMPPAVAVAPKMQPPVAEAPAPVMDATQALNTPAADPAITAVTDPALAAPPDVMTPASQDAVIQAPQNIPAPQDMAAAVPEPEDLPVPKNVNVAPVQPSPATPVTPVTATPGAAPNAAEMAIVQNAAVLDQLSQPNAGTVVAQTSQDTVLNSAAATSAGSLDALAEQEAVIRPLPKQYLIVRKSHDAEDVDSRLTAARTALAQNRNSGALELFNELYKDYPRDHRVLMGRAVALQKMGQNDSAISAYEDVLTLQPQNLEALTNMLGLLKVQDPALAVQKLSELQQAYPYNADIAAQLGIAEASQGSYEQAARYLDIADALKPGSASVLYNKAVLYDKMGHLQQAADLYRQVVRMYADGNLDEQLPIEAIKRRLSVIK